MLQRRKFATPVSWINEIRSERRRVVKGMGITNLRLR